MGQFIITQLTLVFPTNTSVRRFIEMGSDKANTQGLGNKVEHSRMPTNFANFLLILTNLGGLIFFRFFVWFLAIFGFQSIIPPIFQNYFLTPDTAYIDFHSSESNTTAFNLDSRTYSSGGTTGTIDQEDLYFNAKSHNFNTIDKIGTKTTDRKF